MNLRLNAQAIGCLKSLLEHPRSCSDSLNVALAENSLGANVVDFGIHCRGGLLAGLELARLCLSDLGQVGLVSGDAAAGRLDGLPRVQVATDHPLTACMGSQYGGWPVSIGDYFAIGSGPMRLCRGQEPLLKKYRLIHHEEAALGVLESNMLPGEAVIQAIADQCQVLTSNLYLCVAPTQSLAGSVQIVARSVEATIHKLHELDIDLGAIHHAFGWAYLPPAAADQMTALGRTNDAILYGGNVSLWMDVDDRQIEQFGPRLPSSSSPEFGRPFQDIFAEHDGDFYKLDPQLFSAARITVFGLQSGHTYQFGDLRPDILEQSFFPATTST